MDETLGDSIEDETDTGTKTDTETETEIHTEKKNELRCPHLECRHKKRSFTLKNNLMRHYHSREFPLPKPIAFMQDLMEGRI